MKSKYITLSIALCSILGVSSCDSYLDINPKQVLTFAPKTRTK